MLELDVPGHATSWSLAPATAPLFLDCGRGPDGEVWRLEEGLPGLVSDCRQLLDADSRFLFLTVYAVRMSSLALGGLLEELFAGRDMDIDAMYVRMKGMMDAEGLPYAKRTHTYNSRLAQELEHRGRRHRHGGGAPIHLG